MWKSRIGIFLIVCLTITSLPQPTHAASDIPVWVPVTSGVWVVTMGVVWFYQNFRMEPRADSPLDQAREAAIDTLTYIATPAELDSLRSLPSRPAIRQFVAEWWREHTPPHRPGWRAEYRRRFQVADQTYGWRSDRGRVSILYGPPDAIVWNTSPGIKVSQVWSQTNTLEWWTYDRPAGQRARRSLFEALAPGQMLFVFADRYGAGVFQQIYSTEPGEVVEPRIVY